MTPVITHKTRWRILFCHKKNSTCSTIWGVDRIATCQFLSPKEGKRLRVTDKQFSICCRRLTHHYCPHFSFVVSTICRSRQQICSGCISRAFMSMEEIARLLVIWMLIGCSARCQIAWLTWTWGDALALQNLGLSVAEKLAVSQAFGSWRTWLAYSVSNHYLCWRTSVVWQGKPSKPLNHTSNFHLCTFIQAPSYACISEDEENIQPSLALKSVATSEIQSKAFEFSVAAVFILESVDLYDL